MVSSIGGLGSAEGTRGFSLWLSSVVMVVVAGLFVAFRVTHRILKRNIGADDYFVIASLVSSVILSITEIKAVENGYGARFKTLSPAQVVLARKWFYGAQIVYKVVLTLNKMSICQMYYRIFSVSSTFFRMGCYTLQGIIVSSGIAFTLGTVWQCTPIAAFWDRSLLRTPGAWCFSQTPWWLSFSVLQILLDFALLGLPIKEILKLNMSRVEKIGLTGVFCTGLFVTFTSIYRATTLAASATDPDPTWGPIPATVWAVVEANSGIIAACLPLLRQPFLTVFKCWVPSSRRATSQGGYNIHSGSGYGQRSAMRADGPADGSGYPRYYRPGGHTVQIGHRSRSSAESEAQFIVGKDIHVLQDVIVTSTESDKSDDGRGSRLGAEKY